MSFKLVALIIFLVLCAIVVLEILKFVAVKATGIICLAILAAAVYVMLRILTSDKRS